MTKELKNIKKEKVNYKKMALNLLEEIATEHFKTGADYKILAQIYLKPYLKDKKVLLHILPYMTKKNERKVFKEVENRKNKGELK